MLSTKVCEDCHNKLATFYYFKQELATKQERLYELLDELKVEALYEDPASDYENVRPEPKHEIDVDIKTEGGYDAFKIPDGFEAIDYEGEFRVVVGRLPEADNSIPFQ